LLRGEAASKVECRKVSVELEPQGAPHESSTEAGFIVGANLPWWSYGGDFGANAWAPEGGLGRLATLQGIEDVFKGLAADGMRWVRWFVLCDGRAGIEWHPDGRPLGLDRFVLPDLAVALDLAERHGLQLVLALFDFLWFGAGREVDGVRLRGRSRAVADEARRERLLDTVVEPILSQFGRSGAVSAWDVVNEPEWATRAFGGRGSQGAIAAEEMRAFIGQVVKRIHSRTIHQATVGLASAKGLPLVRDLGLDLYQIHWYDQLEADSPLDRPVSALDLDRPVLLGEFPTRGSARSAASILEAAQASGYAGALAWSVRASDAASDYLGRAAEIAAWHITRDRTSVSTA
jgi:hypothetical protein